MRRPDNRRMQGLRMRISATSATTTAAGAPTVRRAAAEAFAVSEETAARPLETAACLRAVGGIEALLALQGIEDPLERRRHAVKRGRLALDALDDLKLGLLGGTLPTAVLNRLLSAAACLKQGSGDADLDTVLAEIELRVEVEIAKIGSA
jgi:Class II flagellar assembly regulator